MGKKSKKKAKVGAASVPVNARCFECSKTVKTSEGKGHTCPGCLQTYCWMCEEKKFGECPNGTDCVHPSRRCQNCTSGRSMFKAMRELDVTCEVKANGKRFFVGRASVATFCDAVATSDKYTHDVMGMENCRNRADGSCLRSECYWCLNDKKVHRLLHCVDCGMVRCKQCGSFDEESGDRIDSAIYRICMETDSQITAETIGEICKDVRPDVLFPCGDCGQHRCTKCCLSDKRFWGTAMMFNEQGRGTPFQDIPLLCNTCYYAKKPCTNPSCPNEVGVPTKRCGGCHISRYCSKECQAVDIPDHVEKCERMQQKLAAKAAKTMNK